MICGADLVITSVRLTFGGSDFLAIQDKDFSELGNPSNLPTTLVNGSN